MEIAIIVFFGSILFGFGLLFLAIRFWRRKRQVGNQRARQFTQNSGATGGVLAIFGDNDSDVEDQTDYSNLTASSPTEIGGATAEISGDLTTSNTETSSDTAWSYNSSESASTSSDSGSWSSCSSSSSDSSSSCSSGSSCGGGGGD